MNNIIVITDPKEAAKAWLELIKPELRDYMPNI
jgi:hypothetical protein